jgi:hypothetical protein
MSTRGLGEEVHPVHAKGDGGLGFICTCIPHYSHFSAKLFFGGGHGGGLGSLGSLGSMAWESLGEHGELEHLPQLSIKERQELGWRWGRLSRLRCWTSTCLQLSTLMDDDAACRQPLIAMDRASQSRHAACLDDAGIPRKGQPFRPDAPASSWRCIRQFTNAAIIIGQCIPRSEGAQGKMVGGQ